MRLIDLRLRTSVRRTLYAVLAMSWTTGLVFYALRRWFQIDGDFGLETHPWQQPVLQIHGAAAFTMLMLIGAMLLNHVPAGWRSGRSRVHGIVLASSMSLMVISAWCLYYLGAEDVRVWIGNVHLLVGMTLPIQIGLHVWLGRRARARSRKERLAQYERGRVALPVRR